MSAIAIARPQLMRDEGLRLHPYRDTVGKLTIGYGRNLDDVGISQAEAEMMLTHDIAQAADSLTNLPVFAVLDDVRQAVLITMAFNLGRTGLMGFRRMWAALAERDYDCAAREMLDSKWARQVGIRAERLAEQMKTGEPQ